MILQDFVVETQNCSEIALNSLHTGRKGNKIVDRIVINTFGISFIDIE